MEKTLSRLLILTLLGLPGTSIYAADPSATPQIEGSAVAGIDPTAGMRHVQTGGKLFRFDKYKLGNGLTVILAQNKSLPMVTVETWYNVATNTEDPNKTGFRHIFEHLLAAEGSENITGDQSDLLTNGVGGTGNATTGMDRVNYFFTLPSNHLATGLWILSDAMGFPSISQESLDRQKNIVVNELGLRHGAPYGVVFNKLIEMSWPKTEDHAYSWDPGGDAQHVRNTTLEDVRAYHEIYYKPNNAILVIYGSFDRQEALKLVAEYFHPKDIPAGTQPLPAVKKETWTPFGGRVEATHHDPGVAQPTQFMVYRVPGGTHEDSAALDALGSLLGGGRTSILSRSLSYEKNMVSDISAGYQQMQEAGLFMIEATPKAGVDLDQLEAAIQAEVDNVIANGIAAEKLQGLKNRLTLADRRAQLALEPVASAMAKGEAMFGDPGNFETKSTEIRALTAADLQGVAAQYLTEDNLGVLKYLPPPAEEAKP
jgi:zinc protease